LKTDVATPLSISEVINPVVVYLKVYVKTTTTTTKTFPDVIKQV
jgi:hypothetical protein